MLRVKNISMHDVLLINDDSGGRAAMIKNGRVIYWNAMVSRKRIAEAANRPLDWSAQSTGRYAVAE